MNTFKILTITLLLTTASTFLFAQDQKQTKEEFLDKAVNAYERCLEMDHLSIHESAIFNVIYMKSKYPVADYEEIIEILNELTVEGETPAIRFKAHIGALYMTYPGLFENIEIESGAENVPVIFKEISDEFLRNSVATN